jgi:prophage regulatory protein
MSLNSSALNGEAKPIRLIRLAEVKRRTGISTSTIYRWMSRGMFPRAHPIGDHIAAWSEAEIEEWIETKVRPAK